LDLSSASKWRLDVTHGTYSLLSVLTTTIGMNKLNIDILKLNLGPNRLKLAMLATTLAIAAAPAQALAGTGHASRHAAATGANATTTKAYIQADFMLAHTARVNMRTGEAAIEGLRRTLGAECPKAAAASPENEAASALSNEVIGAMSVVFIRSDAEEVDDFSETVARLHWSNPQLNRKVDDYAAKFKTLAALELPDVCGDVRAWAASGYKTLPASTTQFDERYKANDVGIGEVPARLLAPYESPREHGVLALTRQCERELVEAEARAVEPWSKILDTLNLQP